MTALVHLGNITCGATFGPLGIDDPHRYRLWRSWSGDLPRWLTFVLLNPSTATHEAEDPTIRRCIGYARAWGFTGLEVLNIFALRSTDPLGLRRVADPVGPENDRVLVERSKLSSKVICGWGNHADLLGRGLKVEKLLRDAHVDRYALKVTQAGHPSHPLYLRADLQPGRL